MFFYIDNFSIKYWFKTKTEADLGKGSLHRLDGPAVEYGNGIDLWYIEGNYLIKSVFDKYIELKESITIEDFIQACLKKINKMSYLHTSKFGTKYYYKTQAQAERGYSELHRLDGPAVEYTDGSKEWWIDNMPLTEEEFNNHPKHKAYLIKMSLEVWK